MTLTLGARGQLSSQVRPGEVYLYIGVDVWHSLRGSDSTRLRLNHLHCATVLDGNAPFCIICLEALMLGKREVAVFWHFHSRSPAHILLQVRVGMNLGLH